VTGGLSAGAYDLIVVNPDRSVGLLENAFLVTADNAPPPIVNTITPGSVVNAAGQQVTILGDHIRAPEITATCALDDGRTMVVSGTGVSGGATSVGVTFNMGSLGGTGVCVVRVENDDGTYADFSALAVTGPSRNLPPTVNDQSMATPRRALVAAAGRVTRQARHLYAIGGDDGSAGGLVSSVETAPVSLFGALDPFFTLPGALPEGRSFAGGAVIGRFIYLVGGRTAAGATTSVRRAQILDPLAAPDVLDLDMVPGEGTGLDPGLYYYRVAAVMAAADPSNPGGETLASDPFGVVVPPFPGKVRLTLFYRAVPGAASYRVYRTAMPGQLAGDVRLVGTVNAPTLQFSDAGAVAQAGVPLPLPQYKDCNGSRIPLSLRTLWGLKERVAAGRVRGKDSFPPARAEPTPPPAVAPPRSPPHRASSARREEVPFRRKRPRRGRRRWRRWCRRLPPG
jgi:hypothetical protein